MITRFICRVFGHDVVRLHMLGRVGALCCPRCRAIAIFPPPGVTDAQVDRVLPWLR